MGQGKHGPENSFPFRVFCFPVILQGGWGGRKDETMKRIFHILLSTLQMFRLSCGSTKQDALFVLAPLLDAFAISQLFVRAACKMFCS